MKYKRHKKKEKKMEASGDRASFMVGYFMSGSNNFNTCSLLYKTSMVVMSELKVTNCYYV
jgi:hypothetical protein